MRAPALVLASLLPLWLALACGGGETAPPPPAPEEAASGSEEEGDPAERGKRRKGGKSKKADGGDQAGAEEGPSDVVAAYLADCHHVFPAAEAAEFEGADGTDAADECRWREFEQNCASDPFDCFNQGQSCQTACGAPCSACQDTCAATCDGCKAGCAGDSACERRCAEARAGCRTTCLEARGTCQAGCGKKEQACDEEGTRKRSEKCPDCPALGVCAGQEMAADRSPASCLEKFPGNDRECLDWCLDY
jgi:hypothetical protein